MRSRMILPPLLGALLMGAAWGQNLGTIQLLGDGGYLGISIRDVVTDDLRNLNLEGERGVVVEDVIPDSPAEDAGLRANDVILAVSGVPILSVRQFQRLIADLPAGRRIDVELSRGGTRRVESVQVGERPGFRRFNAPPQREFFERLAPHFNFGLGDGSGGVFRLDGRPRLGIQGVGITRQLADFLGVSGGEGVLVMEVVEDSPASRAGLRAGDVITRLADRSVADLPDLRDHLKPGKHQLEIVRDKRIQSIEITLEDVSHGRSGSTTRM